MDSFRRLICCLVGGTVYIANSAILPTWSHALVGVFSGLIFIVAYWLIGKKLNMWIRFSISVAVAILAAAIVRLICV